jgi:hypothetical protein
MTGRRVYCDDQGCVALTQPGDYGKAEWGDWYVRLPNWTDEALKNWGIKQVWLGTHSVEEHEDGSVTISPSILWGPKQHHDTNTHWHGYLEHGVWREC